MMQIRGSVGIWYAGGRGWREQVGYGWRAMANSWRGWAVDGGTGGGLREARGACGCADDEAGSGDADRYQAGGGWWGDVGSGVGQDCGRGAAAGDAVGAGCPGCAAVLSAVQCDRRGGQAGLLGLLLPGACGRGGWAEANVAGSAYGTSGGGEEIGRAHV